MLCAYGLQEVVLCGAVVCLLSVVGKLLFDFDPNMWGQFWHLGKLGVLAKWAFW